MTASVRSLARIALLAALAGCAAPEPSGSRTGGLTLEMLEHRSPTAAAFYLVERDGTLAFGGGSAARQRRTSWSGPLTDEEIAELRRLVETHAWLERDPPDVEDGSGMLYEIAIRDRSGRQRFEVHRGSPGVAEIAAILETAARRRLAADLEALPRPGGEGAAP